MILPLHYLIYRSEMAVHGSEDTVDGQVMSIVEAAKVRNKAEGVTGALVVTAGVIVQVLEGPLEAVETTFERICRDVRHRRLRLLEFTASRERAFGDWSMAKVTLTSELTRLCATLDGLKGGRANSSAAAVAKIMRSSLIVG